ncbi:helix-turn-helix domain-containing protein [Neorhizobium sp. T786]|uniref:helix-turn-helix transcriptional regulator n=1 Tax=Pseudorhizobium xiangyangii TaxID=2883104 RepID=UPI001CFFEDF5|nr:helix-turn-helix domain-containing protein [Neorhizobium xiangyangii]MCB5203522.1 helix-turn-helix domain-containing protein [Neorhizobium xiangyangii]
MRKSSKANLLDKQQHDRDAQLAATGNAYAAATGVTDIAPSEDEYTNQFADLIAQKVLGALLPKIGAAQKLERTSIPAAHAPAKAEQLLTDNEVAALFKVSKQTIWRWIKTSEGFPKPLKVEKGSTRWRLSEVVAYEARMAGER